MVNYYILPKMDSTERLNLKKLVDQSDAVDNTETIRRVKHSAQILEGIRVMEHLKRNHRDLRESTPEDFAELCRTECAFMFNHYTDIFNKQLKDELNLGIMIRLIHVLRMIEDGAVDQHEGSVIVGKFLKELYVDSALRRADNLDKEHDKEHDTEDSGIDVGERPEPKPISWKQFKQIHT